MVVYIKHFTLSFGTIVTLKFIFSSLHRLCMKSCPLLHIDCWAKVIIIIPHANQDTNTAIESYHCTLKTWYLHECQKKCQHQIAHLYFNLVYRINHSIGKSRNYRTLVSIGTTRCKVYRKV